MHKVKPETARSYINAVRSFHLERNLPIIAFNDTRFDLVIRGGKRVYSDKGKRLWLPLTAPILLQIVNEVRNDEEGINVKIALSVAFAVFLQSGEFMWDSWTVQHHQFHLAHNHIQFNSDFVMLTIPASKVGGHSFHLL